MLNWGMVTPEEKDRLTRVINLGIEIQEVRDLDILLERVLFEARSLVNADAGSIYMKEAGRLKFSYAQNDTLQAKLPPGRKLIYSTSSVPIDNESISGYVAGTGRTINLPDVYFIPEEFPFSYNRKYDELSGYRTKSMLTLPLKTSRGDVVGVLQLINCRDCNGKTVPLAKEDEPLITHFANTAAAAIERAQMTRAMILRMIKMAELRDPKETSSHVNRVASYAVAIYERWAEKKGLAQKVIDSNKQVLRMAAMLHDVGKIAISDLILKKPARLMAEEYEIMKQHTFFGARLFSELHSDFDEMAFVVALNHHERWDGKGYPGHIDPFTGSVLPGCQIEGGRARGKKGEEIPVFGRIVAVADVFDALCSHRVYKEKWTEPEVLSNIESEKGKQFDPEVVEAFFESLDVIHNMSERYPDHE